MLDSEHLKGKVNNGAISSASKASSNSHCLMCWLLHVEPYLLANLFNQGYLLMKEIIVIDRTETVLHSFIKDSYTLLTQIILLAIAIHTENTGWTILAFIAIGIFAITKASKRLYPKPFKSYSEAIDYLKSKG